MTIGDKTHVQYGGVDEGYQIADNDDDTDEW